MYNVGPVPIDVPVSVTADRIATHASQAPFQANVLILARDDVFALNENINQIKN